MKPISKIGIVAPSSVIPKIEFEIGCDFLRAEGFDLSIHPSVYGEHYFYPAPDEARAQALIEFALNDDLQALWCARGGYGATHLLPYLERAKTKLKKAKKKTLIGYSDATALLEWFRVNLGWTTFHSPMPSLRTFSLLKSEEWASLKSMLQGKTKYSFSLTPIYLPAKKFSIVAPLVGGNLFVWNSLLGTKNVGNARGKILFLEEVGENVGRINRMIHHLEQTGGFKGVKALILGDFLDCPDSVPMCLKEPTAQLENPPKDLMKPLRTIHESWDALQFVFVGCGARQKLPVLKGVPVGHGPNHHSLHLGLKHKLNQNSLKSL